jgi:hypothetical protein
MKKTTQVAGALAISAIAFMFSAQPAFADTGYIDSAVNALQGDNAVYVDSDVSLDSQSQINNGFTGTNIDVVVLPELATGTYTPTDIASQIRASTGDTTVVVVIDKNSKDTIAVSSSTNQTEIATVLNEALTKNGGNAGEAITTSMQEVKDLSAGNTSSIVGGGDTGLGFVLLPVLLVVAAAGASLIFFLKKRKNRYVITSVKAQQAPTKFSELIPETLVPMLKQLSDLMKKHNNLNHGSLSAELHTIINNLQELFTRLNKKGTTSQQRMAEVEYADKLPKLIEALGNNYYIDIVEHNELWDNSEERLEAVGVAVKAVEKQLVENIRQVNASKDLEFQVALGSLVGSSNSANINDVFKKQISEKE